MPLEGKWSPTAMRHILSLAIFALAGAGAVAPAQSQKVFAGIAPVSYSKAWAPNEWHVYALPDGNCFAIAQEPRDTPFKFWGFRQSPGSRVELFFGSIENARPRTVQMSFNDGGKFDYPARVVRQLDWDAYAISLQPNALSVFHNQTIVEAYVGGVRVFAGITNSMRYVEKTMRKCLEWQAAH
jgi:hypothetical protein